MPLVENDDVIQKLSAKTTDHAFNISVLPGRGRRRDDLIDTERIDLLPNSITIDTVAISQQITRSGVERKRFNELLGSPLGRRMFRHIEVDNSPSVMCQYEEHEQYLECRRWHDEEVDSDKLFQVLIEKRPPSGGGQPPFSGFVLLFG